MLCDVRMLCAVLCPGSATQWNAPHGCKRDLVQEATEAKSLAKAKWSQISFLASIPSLRG